MPHGLAKVSCNVDCRKRRLPEALLSDDFSGLAASEHRKGDVTGPPQIKRFEDVATRRTLDGATIDGNEDVENLQLASNKRDLWVDRTDNGEVPVAIKSAENVAEADSVGHRDLAAAAATWKAT